MMKYVVFFLLFFSFNLCADEPVHFSTDSVIHLRKNTNNNQVHYEVRVDESCRPLKRKPVRAYWLMLEKGIDQTEKIRFWERPGYGVRQPRTVQWVEGGGNFEFRIRGVPERVITLETFSTTEGCRARATIMINGERALFEWIEIDVSGWANVHRVEIFGRSITSGEAVREITFP